MAKPTPKRKADGPAEQGDYTPGNILVTGGAGFIASHVVILLVKKYPQYKARRRDRHGQPAPADCRAAPRARHIRSRAPPLQPRIAPKFVPRAADCQL